MRKRQRDVMRESELNDVASSPSHSLAAKLVHELDREDVGSSRYVTPVKTLTRFESIRA